jgi:ABC-type amino acid transport substrate-binding protein
MKKLFGSFALSLVVLMAHAQAPLDQGSTGPADLIFKVSSPKGTYVQLANQIAQVCSKPSLSISTSDGQLALYNDLVTNKANIGFLTAPILFGKKLIEKDVNVDKVVVVMPMYTAELHIVALRANNQINQFTDLGNKRVATFGGAFITGRIVLGQAGLKPITYNDYKTEASALQALQKGEADVVLIEVGQPATWAQELNGQIFKLVEFNAPGLLGRNGFVQASLSYPNLSQTAVTTLGTQVYMVSQNYKGEKKVRDISALKQCIAKNITTLREETGYHAKWADVHPDAKSDWPMFQTVSAPAQATSRPARSTKK